MIRVAFRTDSSLEIGTGHVMRCLALAVGLRDTGADCHFICRAHEGNITERIVAEGFSLTLLPAPQGFKTQRLSSHATWLGVDWFQDASDSSNALGANRPNWLVVDHYALDANWEMALRPACDNILAIDDLADRPHHCDLLLDQSLGRSSADYLLLVPDSARMLIGPSYALLRPEFPRLRLESLYRRKNPVLRRILITLGGVDKDNVTSSVLDILDHSNLCRNIEIEVVMGATAPWLSEVFAKAQQMKNNTKVKVDISNMARLMAASDLVIGAGGTTAWERCALGLPSITLVLAANQEHVACLLEKAGATFKAKTDVEGGRVFRDFLSSPDILQNLSAMSSAASKITDGFGVRRVIRAMDPTIA